MGLGWRLHCLEKYVVFRGLMVLQRPCPCLNFFHKVFSWRCFCQKKTCPGDPAFQQESGCQFPCPVFCCLQDSKAMRELAAWHLLPPTGVCPWVPQLPLLTLLHAIRNLLTTGFWCHSLLSPEMPLNPCMAARPPSMHQTYLISCSLQPGIFCVSENCCHVVAVAVFYIPRLGAKNEVKGQCVCIGLAETEKNGGYWWNKEVLINILLRSSCLRSNVKKHICRWPSGCLQLPKNIMGRCLSLYATVTLRVRLPVNKSRM